MFSLLWIAILDLLFPLTCLRCGSEGAWLCCSCQATLPERLQRWCPECGAVEAAHSHRATPQTTSCDAIFSLVPYQLPWVEHGVHAMKYGGAFGAATAFGLLLAERFAAELPRSGSREAIVAPMPMHRGKERRRGYNQASLIASAFARSLTLPFAQLLDKTRNTRSQATQSRDDRLKNLAGSVIIRRQWPALVLHGKTVILIDDVVTTGATAEEACRILKNSGAAAVTVVTIAYSVLQRQRSEVEPLASAPIRERHPNT